MFTVHRAERAGPLVDALAGLLADVPADAFTPEVIAVPARGVERWLTQQLALRLGGIAANLAFPSPTRLVDDTLAAVIGLDAESDPWSFDRLAWTVLTVVDANAQQAWCRPLAQHLGVFDPADSPRRARRYATAATLAGLFTRYARERPQLLLDWVAGLDQDGAGTQLDDDLHWQAELWRAVRAEIAAPGPAERLAPACERLRTDPALVELPDRISLFGATRLSVAELSVLQALSAGRDVHLWLVHPSPALWQAVAATPPPARRRLDPAPLQLQNPLATALTRDIRELQQRLSPLTARGRDVHHPGPDPVGGLLAAVRADLVGARPPGGSGRVPADGSIQIHACHGAARQVEVLRELLLGALQADPTLQPRDVIVLCPDVDAYAPLITAAFGPLEPDDLAPAPDGHADQRGRPAGLAHPGHRLRVRLADRGLAATNPLLDVAETVLRLADGRVSATEVLDLAACAPVARRFGFAPDDLEVLRGWLAETGARWGLGTAERERFGLAGITANTIGRTVDRVLVGVTADEGSLALLGDTLPLDDVDSTDAALAGRLAEFTDRLGSALAALSGEQPVAAWRAALLDALSALTATAPGDEWQPIQTERVIASLTRFAPAGLRLRLADVRSMLASGTAARPTRRNFCTGDLTVCTLVPMRSVPHRMVVLLGLDDDVYPRTGRRSGDDVLARDPVPGERDPRSEDRQLLLDALMSAGERFVVLYTGADPVTGGRRPPPPPLAELIDTVRATATDPDAVVVRQPLQPFAAVNFETAGPLAGAGANNTAGPLAGAGAGAASTGPFSFDRRSLAGAVALAGPVAPAAPFLTEPLPPIGAADGGGPIAPDVDLADLVAFVSDPTAAFLRQRLGIVLARDDGDELSDALPLTLDGLTEYQIGDRLLAALVGGGSKDAMRRAELGRGLLPPLMLGTAALDDILDTVDELGRALHRAVEAERDSYDLPAGGGPPIAGPSHSLDVTVTLPGGRRLAGTVGGLHGRTLLRVGYARLSARQRLRAWVQLLALAAGTGRDDWAAVIIGRSARGDRIRWSRLAVPTAAGETLQLLAQLVGLRDRGLVEPLPLTAKASARYAQQRYEQTPIDEALVAAAELWTGSYAVPGEADDPAARYVYGPGAPFDRLRHQVPTPGESYPTERDRFGVLARLVWDPLLANEIEGPL